MTQVVLIGTGTPNPDPYRSGPCIGIYSDGIMYLVDLGTGLIRNLNKVADQLVAFSINQLSYAFLTHLHSDHTLGLSDLIITPWILGRVETVKIFGPLGTDHMVSSIIDAYKVDIYERIHGLENANTTGYQVEVKEITPGIIALGQMTVEAIPVSHGNLKAYAYKFTTPDKTIVISGDTAPCPALIEASKGCDILVHEVYFAEGLNTRSEQWQKYHQSVHTSAVELGAMANEIQPKKLVLYHQLFMQENILDEDMTKNNLLYKEKILNEIKLSYNGDILYGEDLMIVE